MSKGTAKIKAISKRALEIREKGGFTTETIVKKHYKVAYIPDAIKQAAKELKTREKSIFKVGNKVNAKNSNFTAPRKVLSLKFQDGIWYCEIQKGNFWKESDLVLFVPKTSNRAKSTVVRGIKTKQLARRAGQNTKSGAKVAKSGISEKATSAIRSAIKLSRFSDIDFASGKLLYSIKKIAGRFTIPDKEKRNAMIVFLLDADYIETLNFSGKYKVTKSGVEFIKTVDQHIQKSKTDKFNPRLF